MKEYELKDAILKFLAKEETRSSSSVRNISENLKVDFYYADYGVDDIIALGLAEFILITSGKSHDGRDRIVTINHRGRFFINSGGYAKLYRKEKRTNLYNILRSALTVVSTIAIIYVAYLNYVATDKANDNKKQITALYKTIDSLRATKKLGDMTPKKP